MLRKLLAGVSLLAAACSETPSDVVNAYMEATQTGDLATLATVSMVGWPGDRVKASEIEAWWVNRLMPGEDEPFQLAEHQRRLNAAREARDARERETTAGADAELDRIQARVERLRAQVELEREEARKSVETWSTVDDFSGVVEATEAEVIIRAPSGDYHYALRLKRYRLAPATDAPPSASHWIVTAIEPVDG